MWQGGARVPGPVTVGISREANGVNPPALASREKRACTGTGTRTTQGMGL
jgi:hypothetical protein